MKQTTSAQEAVALDTSTPELLAAYIAYIRAMAAYWSKR